MPVYTALVCPLPQHHSYVALVLHSLLLMWWVPVAPALRMRGVLGRLPSKFALPHHCCGSLCGQWAHLGARMDTSLSSRTFSHTPALLGLPTSSPARLASLNIVRNHAHNSPLLNSHAVHHRMRKFPYARSISRMPYPHFNAAHTIFWIPTLKCVIVEHNHCALMKCLVNTPSR